MSLLDYGMKSIRFEDLELATELRQVWNEVRVKFVQLMLFETVVEKGKKKKLDMDKKSNGNEILSRVKMNLSVVGGVKNRPQSDSDLEWFRNVEKVIKESDNDAKTESMLYKIRSVMITQLNAELEQILNAMRTVNPEIQNPWLLETYRNQVPIHAVKESEQEKEEEGDFEIIPAEQEHRTMQPSEVEYTEIVQNHVNRVRFMRFPTLKKIVMANGGLNDDQFRISRKFAAIEQIREILEFYKKSGIDKALSSELENVMIQNGLNSILAGDLAEDRFTKWTNDGLNAVIKEVRSIIERRKDVNQIQSVVRKRRRDTLDRPELEKGLSDKVVVVKRKKEVKPRQKFSAEENRLLIEGLNEFGWGKWSKILNKGGFHPERDSISLKDRARNLKLPMSVYNQQKSNE
mmetsp:Transcript_8337/g.15087  ORF Transcript_8337/g.15087 Transcript_8337/m.15087 type:complete len:404 (-) Transcript_8337:91-1302(-)